MAFWEIQGQTSTGNGLKVQTRAQPNAGNVLQPTPLLQSNNQTSELSRKQGLCNRECDNGHDFKFVFLGAQLTDALTLPLLPAVGSWNG